MKSKRKTLAVIIPNYNNEKFLRKCIDSVLSQTVLPDEIIVVDDCSTDNSVQIIKDYESKHNIVHGIFLKKNMGVSHARNVGLLASTSEYVTALDADDYYYNSHKLQNEMDIIENHDGNVLVYSKLVYVDDKDNLIRYVNYPKRHYLIGHIEEKLIAGYRENTIPRDYCYPRSAIDKIGLYDESSSLFEDLDYLIRLSKILPAYCTFEYGTAYRIKSYGLSQRPRNIIIKAKKDIFTKYYKNRSLLSKIKICYFKTNVTMKKILKHITRLFLRK